MEQIRSFIAIELSPEIKAGLARLENEFRAGQHPFVKWVDPEGIHLTLKFLGNVSPEQIPPITGALTQAAQRVMPFCLEIGGVGVFPNLQSPRVAWVAVAGDTERLLALKGGIDQSLAPLGFAPEARGFSPHLTLGRVREGTGVGERRRLGQAISSLKVEAMPSLTVSSVSLMRSKLTPAGAIYSCLASARLGLPTSPT